MVVSGSKSGSTQVFEKLNSRKLTLSAFEKKVNAFKRSRFFKGNDQSIIKLYYNGLLFKEFNNRTFKLY
jgi:hypothetical protein